MKKIFLLLVILLFLSAGCKNTLKDVANKDSSAELNLYKEVIFNDKNIEFEVKKTLKKENITSDDLTKIKILTLEGYSEILDLTDLLLLTNLEILYITDSNFTNETNLSKIDSLKKLELKNNNLSNIDFITNLTNLEELYILNHNITEFESIGNLLNLKRLHLTSIHLTDISFLSQCLNLEILTFENTNINNIDVVENFKNLEYLTLRQNNCEIDLSPVMLLENLQQIDLWNTKLTNAEILEAPKFQQLEVTR